jgi:hypothetical protein
MESFRRGNTTDPNEEMNLKEKPMFSEYHLEGRVQGRVRFKGFIWL